MTYKLNLEIDISKTDPNKTHCLNRFAKHKIFQKVKSDIHKLSLGKTPSVPLISFKISITRMSMKFLDWDNLVASLKPVIDGLVLAKVIEDDSWQYIKHIDCNQVKSKEKKLIINVEEVNG